MDNINYKRLKLRILTNLVESGIKNEIPNEEIQTSFLLAGYAMDKVSEYYEAILAEKNKIW